MRWLYFLGRAAASIAEAKTVSALTTITIALALLLCGAYVASVDCLDEIIRRWGRVSTISAALADTASPEAWSAAARTIAEFSDVETAELVYPEEALERFRRRGPEAAALVDGVDAGALPATVEIELATRAVDLAETTRAIVAQIAAVPAVVSVDYGERELRQLQRLVRIVKTGGAMGALLLALATVFVVSSTIRLTIMGRKDEIEILDLVGATRWFIRVPFLLEGAAWGLGGGLLALVAMASLQAFMVPHLGSALSASVGGIGGTIGSTLDLQLLTPALQFGLPLGGLVLGVSGSAAAVRRCLNARVA